MNTNILKFYHQLYKWKIFNLFFFFSFLFFLFLLLGEEIIDNFEDENLSNVVLYDVDVVMENTEESTALSATNNIAVIFKFLNLNDNKNNIN